jgi:antitoxin component of RelBE/YafQ-DinJ toxin-antitoxin module
MTPSEKKKDEYIHQRIDKDLKDHFKKAAEKDGRTMANALIMAIKDYVKKITGKDV